MVSKLYSNDPSRFVMPELLTIDTFFALLAHLVSQMYKFMCFQAVVVAILNFAL